MSTALRVLQVNLGKRRMVQHSLLNDEDLIDYGILFISEPSCFRDDNGQVVAPPSGHPQWSQLMPTTTAQEGRFPIRCLMYVSKDMDAQPIHAESPGLTGARIKIQDRPILVISTYVPATTPYQE
jgi:hypothetical protein